MLEYIVSGNETTEQERVLGKFLDIWKYVTWVEWVTRRVPLNRNNTIGTYDII